jgi:hypothetical protein
VDVLIRKKKMKRESRKDGHGEIPTSPSFGSLRTS